MKDNVTWTQWAILVIFIMIAMIFVKVFFFSEHTARTYENGAYDASGTIGSGNTVDEAIENGKPISETSIFR